MQKDISVIIVTYNSEKHIYDCLDSLFKYNDIGEALEVIIVDNKSDHFNETKTRLIEKYGKSLVIIENDFNGGYGQGNNVGIRVSTAPIIMIMNPDVRLIEPLFKKAISSFETAEVVQYGLRLLDKDGRICSSIGISNTIPSFIRMPLSVICNKKGWFFPKKMYLVGACFFIRKSSFEDIGLFDEHIFMYGEEQDIHDRLLKSNSSYTIVYDNNASCLHLHGLYADKSKPDYVDFEPKALKSHIAIQERKGIPQNKTIKHYIMFIRIKLVKAWLRHLIKQSTETREYVVFLRSFIKDMKMMLKER